MQTIPLYNRARRSIFTIVDDQDYEAVIGYRWKLNSKGYVIRSYSEEGVEIIVNLHRELMQPPPGLVVDHIDHDKLNNTRSNLRAITQQENLFNRRRFKNNSTGFKGVTFQKGKWHARIEKDGVGIHLGFHEDLLTAARIYDCAAIRLFGIEYAWLNLPEQPIPSAIEALVSGYLARRG